MELNIYFHSPNTPYNLRDLVLQVQTIKSSSSILTVRQRKGFFLKPRPGLRRYRHRYRHQAPIQEQGDIVPSSLTYILLLQTGMVDFNLYLRSSKDGLETFLFCCDLL